jgi:DNA polymerase epsilon subunit 2
MADPRQRTIIKVSAVALYFVWENSSTIWQVFRKYSHSLGPDTLDVLEDICDQHGFADDEIEHIMETLATEYNKQDGG